MRVGGGDATERQHRFSTTLAEHNAYVEQYNTWCKANVGRCA